MIIFSYILVINEMLDNSDGDKILLQCNNYQDDHQPGPSTSCTTHQGPPEGSY